MQYHTLQGDIKDNMQIYYIYMYSSQYNDMYKSFSLLKISIDE